nr:protein tweety homolog 2-like [Salvelinus alpinus]
MTTSTRKDPLTPRPFIWPSNPVEPAMYTASVASAAVWTARPVHTPTTELPPSSPTSEYMNQSMLFGENPRYENFL